MRTKVGLRLALCGVRFGGQDLGWVVLNAWLVGLGGCGAIEAYSAL